MIHKPYRSYKQVDKAEKDEMGHVRRGFVVLNTVNLIFKYFF